MVNKIRFKSFEEIPVWRSSHKLTIEVYKITKKFPAHEQYGLTSQLRRSSSSIAANIAEGFGKYTTKEFIKFLYNSRGSCVETVYYILLARDLEYVTDQEYLELRKKCDEIGKQLNGWMKSLKVKLVNH